MGYTILFAFGLMHRLVNVDLSAAKIVGFLGYLKVDISSSAVEISLQ